MMPRAPRVPLLACLASFALGEQPGVPVEVQRWEGYDRVDISVAGREAVMVRPAAATMTEAGRPWIWRTEFFGFDAQVDIALLGLGWHVLYCEMSGMYGTPEAIDLMAAFHGRVTSEHHLARRVVLEGFSRGALYAVNFAAAHPNLTAALYLDAPVLDVRSWPGGHGSGQGHAGAWREVLALYNLTEESAADFERSPLHSAEKLAVAGIPIVAVAGLADSTVPFSENLEPFAQRYRAAGGGDLPMYLKDGGDHHPHSLDDPTPIVEFLVQNALQDDTRPGEL